jgi:hypothetical protein
MLSRPPRSPGPADPAEPAVPRAAAAPRSGLSLPSLRAAAGVFAASAAAAAVGGIPAGFLWGALAPRVLVRVVSSGTAEIVRPETSAFIAADLWFCLIGVAGGLLTGVLGYRLAVRRHGPAAAAGLIAGALGAAAITLWIGDNYGLAGFRHQLAHSPPGTRLHASLALGATSGLVFWPLAAAFVIAVSELAARLRTRARSRADSPAG